MASVHPCITPELEAFIRAQPLFFVASAPLSREGRVNVSPKGLDTLRILSPTSLAYLDLTGSGNETACHLLENGRITFMFCAFDGAPKILRLFGQGRSIQPGNPEWNDLAAHYPAFPGVRQIILAEIGRVQTSCGFGVPAMRLESQRKLLGEWTCKKTAEELAEYRRRKNSRSIDGLPAPGYS